MKRIALALIALLLLVGCSSKEFSSKNYAQVSGGDEVIFTYPDGKNYTKQDLFNIVLACGADNFFPAADDLDSSYACAEFCGIVVNQADYAVMRIDVVFKLSYRHRAGRACTDDHGVLLMDITVFTQGLYFPDYLTVSKP